MMIILLDHHIICSNVNDSPSLSGSVRVSQMFFFQVIYDLIEVLCRLVREFLEVLKVILVLFITAIITTNNNENNNNIVKFLRFWIFFDCETFVWGLPLHIFRELRTDYSTFRWKVIGVYYLVSNTTWFNRILEKNG